MNRVRIFVPYSSLHAVCQGFMAGLPSTMFITMTQCTDCASCPGESCRSVGDIVEVVNKQSVNSVQLSGYKMIFKL